MPDVSPSMSPRGAARIAKAKAGDRAAFGALVELHGARLFTFLVRRQGSRSEAQDLSQIVFFRAWTKLETFRADRGCFSTWLLAIANRVVVSEARRRRVVAPLLTAGESADSRNPLPGELLSAAESRRNLWALVDETLTPHIATVVWLRYGEDLDVVDIAHVLGWTTVRVRVTLFRARQQLLRAIQTLDIEARLSRGRPVAEGESTHAPA